MKRLNEIIDRFLEIILIDYFPITLAFIFIIAVILIPYLYLR